jgi:hypothetical protein
MEGPATALSERHYWTPEMTLRQAGAVSKFRAPETVGAAEHQQWLALDVAYWLREHHVAGLISEEAASESEDICELGLERAARVCDEAELWSKRRLSSYNVLALGGLSRWLSGDRYEKLETISDEVLADVEAAVDNQLYMLSDAARSIAITPDKARFLSNFGFVFELVSAGMVLQSPYFRRKRFIPLVAKPTYENRRPDNPSPIDILLLQHNALTEAAPVVAGLQCKGMRWSKKVDFIYHDPYVHLLRSTHLVGNRMMSPSRTAVDLWDDPQTRPEILDRFIKSVALNGQCVLRDLLEVHARTDPKTGKIVFKDRLTQRSKKRTRINKSVDTKG